MARVYSTNFLDIGPLFGPVLTTYVIPEGVTAIIREMTYTSPGTPLLGLDDALLVTFGNNLACIWRLTNQNLDPARTYMWEGREVSTGPGELQVSGRLSESSFRANGYLLTP